MYQILTKTYEARIIGKQLIRSSTSVAANCRAVNRASSQSEYFAKLCIVVEEADESLFWIKLLEESGIVEPHKLSGLKQEAEEIIKITTSAKNKSFKVTQSNKPIIKS